MILSAAADLFTAGACRVQFIHPGERDSGLMLGFIRDDRIPTDTAVDYFLSASYSGTGGRRQCVPCRSDDVHCTSAYRVVRYRYAAATTD